MAISIFLAYARKDELLVTKLENYLTRILQENNFSIHKCEISQIDRGDDLSLSTADLILLLVSPDFLDSDYCYRSEMAQVMKRYERNEAQIIPIILRPVYWGRTPFSQLQALPENTKPITLSDDQEATFGEIALAISTIAKNKGVGKESDGARKGEPETIKVLFVLSNPRGSDDLRLSIEMRAIQEALPSNSKRERIQSRILSAATVSDLRRAMLDESYQIVHLIGHGASDGFMLKSSWEERSYRVPLEALAVLFGGYYQTLRCVILNACYPLPTSKSISLGISVVIAMSETIHNQTSIEFLHGFYNAIDAGMDIERAYREGLNAVRLASLDHDTLALLLRE